MRPFHALILVTACNQSVFDRRTDEADGGVGMGEDGASIDAVVGGTCPAPCLGDAVADFSDGPTSGPWRYLEDARDLLGVAYTDLAYGSWNGLNAWTGASGAPAIASCPDNPGASACAGAPGDLLVQPSPSGPGAGDPVLAFTVPQTERVRITGSVRSQDGGAIGVRLRLARNSRNDALAYLEVPTGDAATFDVEAEVLIGDRLLTSLEPTGVGAVAPVELRLYVSRVGTLEETCMLGLRFDDDGAPLHDECRNADLENRNGAVAMAGRRASVTGHGMAVDIPEGQWLLSTGGGMDYHAEFTVQFWGYVDAEPALPAAFYGDDDCVEEEGVVVLYDGFSVDAYSFYDGENPDCGAPETPIHAGFPGTGEWHFYRLVRTIGTGVERLRLCIDGDISGEDPIPGFADMSANWQPTLGRDSMYGNAYFDGAIDDVRILKRALPCP